MLSNRKFKTGTLIKLYDYDLPEGTRGAIPKSRVGRSTNTLFEPALPIYLMDSREEALYRKILFFKSIVLGLSAGLERTKISTLKRLFRSSRMSTTSGS